MCHAPFLGLGGIAKQNEIHPKCMGGAADHVHLLLSMPTPMATAKAIPSIKSGSSAWIHQTFRELRNFGWQQGYGCIQGERFSVCQKRSVPSTIRTNLIGLELVERSIWPFEKSAQRKVRPKISLGRVSKSTVPPGRVHFSLVSRHFVPGYFHLVPPGQAILLVPPGQDTLFRCRIFLKSTYCSGREVP
ncbi:MAG: transposase [Verrucomicrobia bacterium]|nr:transposase [Verrucomicrobiota bacterium]